MEGTVLRSGDRVRITAQLIEASTDKHLWSQSYEGELRDTLALQSKVAGAIADQIRINVNPQEQESLCAASVSVTEQAFGFTGLARGCHNIRSRKADNSYRCVGWLCRRFNVTG